ncbi:hypothetical protein K461DRAFT_60023 [Myriangium duriaei CBS 260.36]|uniref:Uncharacterized protein n=1 Tax=Myriangium duriaei CBS 260.36 TaxID=1168546 RepID=A0A9P4ITW4_9PEZI|nr:hypothetical protein K461DRAFT_60023 [Myriangium duriaei CBS 260.36]
MDPGGSENVVLAVGSVWWSSGCGLAQDQKGSRLAVGGRRRGVCSSNAINIASDASKPHRQARHCQDVGDVPCHRF